MLREKMGLEGDCEPFTDMAGKMGMKDLLDFSTAMKDYTKKFTIYLLIKIAAYLMLLVGVIMILTAIQLYLGYQIDNEEYHGYCTLVLVYILSALSVVLGATTFMTWMGSKCRTIALDRIEKDMEDFYRKD